MAKYSYELKKKIVSAYLNGEGGYGHLSSIYGPDKKDIIKWVNNYQAFGDEGLICSRQQEKYSFEKKFFVVEFYLSNEISYQELAIQEGITNPSLIATWVNRFRAAGPDALRSHKKGRKKVVDKTKIEVQTQQTEERIVDTSAEHVKELEDELLKLRIENAFLKELRRLRLEDETKMRERRSSSIASEESSN